MKIEDAAKILASMCEEALPNEKALSVHFFGVKYANQIRNIPSQELAVRAGLQKSYGTEIRKGINLAKYVEVRKK